MSNRRKTDYVLVLLVHDGDDHVVIVRDLKSDHPYKWEFPGGRLFEGESHEAAAERILERELDIRIESLSVGRPVAEIVRGGRMVTSVRVNLPDGPGGNLQRFSRDKRHELRLIEKRELRTYMPRKEDRDLMQIGYRG